MPDADASDVSNFLQAQGWGGSGPPPPPTCPDRDGDGDPHTWPAQDDFFGPGCRVTDTRDVAWSLVGA